MTLNNQTKTEVRNLQEAILMPTSSIFDWASYYTTINYCNKVLEKGQEMVDNRVDPSFTSSQWLPIKAEMLGLRALSYFYLVRAYRDVPYVDKAISTDAEAMAVKPVATKGANILGDLISQLEESKGRAAENFGTSSENKGRLTRRGIKALLADMYMWRGALMTKALDKGDTLTAMPVDTVLLSSISSVGDTLTAAQLTSLSTASYKRTIELADEILDEFQEDYDELLEKNPNMNVGKKKRRYDYLTYQETYSGFSSSDQIYEKIFGLKNSTESIFEIQYDGTNLENSTVNNLLATYNPPLTATLMAGNGNLTGSIGGSYDPEVGFGKTDMRALETYNYSPTAKSNPAVHKHLLHDLVIKDMEDMSQGVMAASYRTSKNANWPIYRLSDIMLMKAEAIARSLPSGTNSKNANPDTATGDVGLLIEGFFLTNAIFERSNPALKATTEATTEVRSDRLDKNYATKTDRTPMNLLNLVYRERQREFAAEGKRWFDIVRQCEAVYEKGQETSKVLGVYNTMTNNVKNRLRRLYSLYNPIYSEEIKISGEESGGPLKQNPIWDRYTK